MSRIRKGLDPDICVLFTANEAYMRDFRIIVPEDCVASEKVERSYAALVLMQRVLKADITGSTQLQLDRLAGSSR